MLATEIKCPICQNIIQIEVTALLRGQKFSCSNCSSCIGLSANSFSTVENALEKYEELKEKTGRK